MTQSIKKHPFRVEREFGLIVGGVFILLGAALLLLGTVFPRALIYPNKAWMKLAEALAFVMTRIILGLVFFLIVTPIGVFKRLTGWDPLHRRAGPSSSYWRPYSERQRDTRHYEKMY